MSRLLKKIDYKRYVDGKPCTWYVHKCNSSDRVSIFRWVDKDNPKSKPTLILSETEEDFAHLLNLLDDLDSHEDYSKDISDILWYS